MNVASFAIAVLQVLPKLLTAGQDALSLLRVTNAALAQMQAENRGPSDAEWTTLNQTIDGLMAELKD